MSGFQDVTQTQVFNDVIAGSLLTIVKFQSELCVICRKLDPMLYAVGKGFETSLLICEADVEENTALADRLNIRSLPTLIMFKSGAEKGRLQGFQTARMLRNWISPILNGPDNEY